MLFFLYHKHRAPFGCSGAHKFLNSCPTQCFLIFPLSKQLNHHNLEQLKIILTIVDAFLLNDKPGDRKEGRKEDMEEEAVKKERLSWAVALETGNYEEVKRHIEEDAEIVRRLVGYEYPTLVAARTKNVKIMRLLLASGADAGGANPDRHRAGHTALQMACFLGDAEMAEVLLSEGKVDANGSGTVVPLLIAAKRHHLGLIKVLDKYGANLHVMQNGTNAIHEVCRMHSNAAIVDYLVSKGVACDLEDSFGRTPLMYLAETGDIASIKILVEKGGAKLDHRSNSVRKAYLRNGNDDYISNDTVLAIAERKKMSEVIIYCWLRGLAPSSVAMQCHLGDLHITRVAQKFAIGARAGCACVAVGSKIFIYGGSGLSSDDTIPSIQATALTLDDYAQSFPFAFNKSLEDWKREKENSKVSPGLQTTDSEAKPDDAQMNVDVNNIIERIEMLQRLQELEEQEIEEGIDMDFVDDGSEDSDFEEASYLDVKDVCAMDDTSQGDGEEKEAKNENQENESSAEREGDEETWSDSSEDSHMDYGSDGYMSDEDEMEGRSETFFVDLDETTLEPIFDNAVVQPKLKVNKLDPERKGPHIKLDADGLGGQAVEISENENYEPSLTVGIKSFNRKRGTFGYFEVHIVATGARRFVSVGLIPRSYPMKGRQPGWDASSFGLHGDDGSLFCNSGSGTQFTDRFEVGDVVGVGWHFSSRRVFFAHNGRFIGFSSVKTDVTRLYPCVAVRNAHAAFRVNFGEGEPFRFDFRAPTVHWRSISPPPHTLHSVDPTSLILESIMLNEKSKTENSENSENDVKSTTQFNENQGEFNKELLNLKADRKFNNNAPSVTYPIFLTEPNGKYLVLLSTGSSSSDDIYLFHLQKLSYVKHILPSNFEPRSSFLRHETTQFKQITPRTALAYRSGSKNVPTKISFFDTVLLRWFDVSYTSNDSKDQRDVLTTTTNSSGVEGTSQFEEISSNSIPEDSIAQLSAENHSNWVELLTFLDSECDKSPRLMVAGEKVLFVFATKYALVDPVSGLFTVQEYSNSQGEEKESAAKAPPQLPATVLASANSNISMGDSGVVFGGWVGIQPVNDVAVFNTRIGMWYKPNYTGTVPQMRSSCGTAFARSRSAYYCVNASDLPSGSLCLDAPQPVFVNAFGWSGENFVPDFDVFSFSNAPPSDFVLNELFQNDIILKLNEVSKKNVSSSNDDGQGGNEEIIEKTIFVPAHKIVLYCRSSILKTMLLEIENQSTSDSTLNTSVGDGKEQQKISSILSLNVESVEAFKGMLHFLYTDAIVKDPNWLAQHARALARLVEIFAPELSPKLLERLLLPRSTLPNLFANQMLQGFANPLFSDLNLELYDAESGHIVSIPVHKVIITSRSPYFKALCTGGLAESAQKSIRIKNDETGTNETPIEALKLVIEFLYTYEVPYDRCSEYIVDMFVLACRFQITKLKSTLENLLIFNLDVSNVIGLILVADTQTASELLSQSIKFYEEHKEEIKSLPEFEELKDTLESIVERHMQKQKADI